MRYLKIAVISSLIALLSACQERPISNAKQGTKPMPSTDPAPLLLIETSMGTIKAQLLPDKAPQTVANFLDYVDRGFYDGLIFHRVIDGFMIQGGGFTPNMQKKATARPIKNEATAKLANDRGTLAMARTPDPHSATSEFFINLTDNAFLNHKSNNPAEFGYCVFGRVTEGLDVLDAIGKVKTTTVGSYTDVPVNTVEIKSIRRAD